MNNLFAGLKDAKVTERGAFLTPGSYQVRIKRVIKKHTRKNYDAYIVEFKVEKSSYELAPKDMPEDKKPGKVGASASWFQSLVDPAVGFGSLKGFAAAILGENPDDPKFVSEVEGFLTETVDRPASGTEPAHKSCIEGVLVPLEVVMIKTKAGKDFSRHVWGKIVEEAS
jgi:hypothetical protein